METGNCREDCETCTIERMQDIEGRLIDEAWDREKERRLVMFVGKKRKSS